MPGLQVLDAVEQGTIECGYTAGYYYGGKESALAIDTCLPFGMGVRQHNAWMLNGGGLELTRQVYKKFNCINFPAGHTGTQMGGWWRAEVKTLADLKGKKMRIPGLGGAIMAKLGVIPQQLSGGDIYPALERGTIDAAEWSVPYDDEKLGFYKVAKFYYSPAFWEPTASFPVIVNLKAWEALPAQFREALEVACFEAYTKVPAAYDAANPEALKRLIAQGVQLRSFSKEIMDAAWVATKQVMAEESAKSADFKRLYDSYTAFRLGVGSWFRVAESPLDNFTLYQAR
ncbi:TRAP transporter substrate-binding protein [Tardibacter chloracetimidivorans]|uniref:TRAP transporter substrate-binding protein n=1 Tax=Tardibacter chloracetimidivorans TaxID=1921510 RepID=UPI000A5C6777|nr:TRAP transporter substrate-binding protein DctP [Tardibacter chloracetimidivorans]